MATLIVLRVSWLNSFGKTTLETGGEDTKPHSKRAEKILNQTRNEFERLKTALKTSVKDQKQRTKLNKTIN